jgi:hypothetical protein
VESALCEVSVAINSKTFVPSAGSVAVVRAFGSVHDTRLGSTHRRANQTKRQSSLKSPDSENGVGNSVIDSADIYVHAVFIDAFREQTKQLMPLLIQFGPAWSSGIRF